MASISKSDNVEFPSQRVSKMEEGPVFGKAEFEDKLPSQRRYDICFMFPTNPNTGVNNCDKIIIVNIIRSKYLTHNLYHDKLSGTFTEKAEKVMKKIMPNIGKQNIHMYYRLNSYLKFYLKKCAVIYSFIFISVDHGEIIVLCRLANQRSRFYADINNLTLLTNEFNLEKRAKQG